MSATPVDELERSAARPPLPHWYFLDGLPAALTSGEDRVGAYRQALADGGESLRKRFEDDEPIEALVRDRARMVDVVLRHAWSAHTGPAEKDVALIAVGGYGRTHLALKQALEPGSNGGRVVPRPLVPDSARCFPSLVGLHRIRRKRAWLRTLAGPVRRCACFSASVVSQKFVCTCRRPAGGLARRADDAYPLRYSEEAQRRQRAEGPGKCARTSDSPH